MSNLKAEAREERQRCLSEHNTDILTRMQSRPQLPTEIVTSCQTAIEYIASIAHEHALEAVVDRDRTTACFLRSVIAKIRMLKLNSGDLNQILTDAETVAIELDRRASAIVEEIS